MKIKVPKNTRAVEKILKQAARDKRSVFYGEIATTIGKAEHRPRPAPQSMCHPVGYIRDRCIERGLPWLNALAVNEETKRPGESFLPDGTFGPAQEALWRKKVLAVYKKPDSYWKNLKLIDPDDE